MDIDAALSQLPRDLRVLLAAITRSKMLMGFYPHWKLCADKPSVFSGRQDACPAKTELNLPHSYLFIFLNGILSYKAKKGRAQDGGEGENWNQPVFPLEDSSAFRELSIFLIKLLGGM